MLYLFYVGYKIAIATKDIRRGNGKGTIDHSNMIFRDFFAKIAGTSRKSKHYFLLNNGF